MANKEEFQSNEEMSAQEQGKRVYDLMGRVKKEIRSYHEAEGDDYFFQE